MKKLLCFATLLLASTGFASQLHSYDQIKSAVTDGKLIRIYFDYTKCSPSSKQLTLPNNAAVYTPNAMSINTAGDIGSYVLYFTMNDPRYPNKAVYQHGKIAISTDNYITLSVSVLNAADFTLLDRDNTLRCKIDDSAKVFIHEGVAELASRSSL